MKRLVGGHRLPIADVRLLMQFLGARGCVIGVDFERPFIAGDRFLAPAGFAKNAGEIGQRIGVGGAKAQRLAVGFDGGVELSAVAKGVALIVVGFGIVRLEGERLAKAGHRLGKSPEPSQRIAHIVVRGRIVRLQRQGPLIACDRVLALTDLVLRDAQIVVGVSVVRPQLGDFGERRAGLVEFAGARASGAHEGPKRR